MPDVNKSDQESSEKRQFIYEKIVKPQITPRQIAKRAAVLMGAAVLFGAVSAAAFVISKPYAERYLGGGEGEEQVTVSYPKDEPDPTAAVQSSVPADEPVPEETEPIGELVQSAMETYEFSAKDVTGLNKTIQELCRQADQGIVTVHSVKRQMDWFDNPVENTGLYAGAVIAITKEELLILTPVAAVESADSIKVTFAEDSEAPGHIKQTDTVSGLAVVSVAAQDVSEDIRESVVSLPLGNSYSVKRGDVIAAVGGPYGMVHSSASGRITYIGKNVQVADGSTRLLYTDMSGITSTGTFLIDMSGSLIGWVTDEFQNSESPGPAVGRAISDYKGALEKLSNGVPVPYLGIQGTEVSEAMIEQSAMPAGLYVAGVIQDSPAYQAGIQSGDIIVRIRGREITNMKDYQGELEKLSSGAVVPVIVQRNGRDEYKEIEFSVTVGAR